MSSKIWNRIESRRHRDTGATTTTVTDARHDEILDQIARNGRVGLASLVNRDFASVADSVERLNERADLVLKSLGFPNVHVTCSRDQIKSFRLISFLVQNLCKGWNCHIV